MVRFGNDIIVLLFATIQAKALYNNSALLLNDAESKWDIDKAKNHSHGNKRIGHFHLYNNLVSLYYHELQDPNDGKQRKQQKNTTGRLINPADCHLQSAAVRGRASLPRLSLIGEVPVPKLWKGTERVVCFAEEDADRLEVKNDMPRPRPLQSEGLHFIHLNTRSLPLTCCSCRKRAISLRLSPSAAFQPLVTY
ncbi:hypothetical protein SKAU_G00325980 [Synaphobranchus kaupii]|uniref:Uncharacterized protein n=1 Tax=Synaphobranchus kaupii TaxID=118154 RepID=A0A9Q1EPQ7_SYNKA|nr:hypothetical protein SKAU_G00325980 [Synaphobranchus kaupii]